MLYSRNEHNIVNQLYFSKKKCLNKLNFATLPRNQEFKFKLKFL